jgi:hypothetical protein
MLKQFAVQKKKTVLPHVVSFDEVALQKILRLGVIQC